MKFSLGALYNGYRQLLRNPRTRMWAVLGTIVYLISPIDFAPDLFPLAGQIDDFVLITLMLSELFQITFSPENNPWQEPQEQPQAQAQPQDPPQRDDRAKTVDVQAVTVDES